MKILYVAKHDSGDNDDEGAITHALTELGHTVRRFQENDHIAIFKNQFKYDFLLFHKWADRFPVRSSRIPAVFWYFDLVRFGDPRMIRSTKTRVGWMQDMIPAIHTGFCTDGDWVASDKSGKLFQLMQGADERTLGFGNPVKGKCKPILFAGAVYGKRKEQIYKLMSKYGDQLLIIGSGSSRRAHGRLLADIFASTKIVIAPRYPSSNLYWSNRVYLTIGLGGFVLHPYCEMLTHHLAAGTELNYYKTDEHLEYLIEYYLEHEEEREQIRKAAFERVKNNHTYRHRCQELISIMEKRLK